MKQDFKYTVAPTSFLYAYRHEIYLLPIQDVEIPKMPAMVQNQGW